MKNEKTNRHERTPAANERFGKMAGVFPLKCSEKLVTACSAGTSVRPATSPSRHHVARKQEKTVVNETEVKR